MISSPLRIAALLAFGAGTSGAQRVPPLPLAISNHAVAAGRVDGTWQLFAMLGIDSTKRWSGISRRAWAWRSTSRTWRELPPVPGPVGRLAATAQVVRGRLYLFGGYTVDSAGGEKSAPAVDIFDARRNRWTAGAPIPVPVDDAVSGVYRDSLVYLVSGWHDTDNVRDVQIYDVVRNRWSSATPVPGPGVFGHSGAIAGNQIVFIDGARRTAGSPRFVNEPQSWIGTIQPSRPDSIVWRKLDAHPAPVRYRAAAGACGTLVLFAGGTDNPYNYDGIGYDSVPSAPLASVMALDTRNGRWRRLDDAPMATMDHRGLPVRGSRAWIVGGMHREQRVASDVVQWTLDSCHP